MGNAEGTLDTSRPLRVLIVAPSLRILGGQAVQADRLHARLRNEPGFEATLLPVNPHLGGVGGVLQRIRYVRTVVTTLVYIWRLLRSVLQADLLHVFSAGYWSFLLAPTPALLVGALFRRPVLLNYRTGEGDDHLRRHRLWVIPLLRLATVVVVPSEYLVGVFRDHGVRAIAISNFVDSALVSYRARGSLTPAFLSNRNLELHYNVACILRAFARIQERHPQATLAVVGDGPERSALEDLAGSLALRNVTFTGRVPPEGMGAWYDASDIYLNASDIDNMPTSLLEAFAAGLPVVSTDAGGIPFIVRHEENGLLVPCNDDDALARAAMRLLDDPDLAATVTASARRDVLANYCWDRISDEWLNCYRRAAAVGRSGSPRMTTRA